MRKKMLENGKSNLHLLWGNKFLISDIVRIMRFVIEYPLFRESRDQGS